jgi:hypothetical protein
MMVLRLTPSASGGVVCSVKRREPAPVVEEPRGACAAGGLIARNR